MLILSDENFLLANVRFWQKRTFIPPIVAGLDC